MTVLVVDRDNRHTRAVINVLLSQGYDVQHLVRGRRAIEAVDASTHAVVVEHKLPDADGIEVCARLRRRSDVALVVVGSGTVDERIRALVLGADDYLDKPFDPRELVARLVAVTRRRAAGSCPLADGGPSYVEVGPVSIDLTTRQLRFDDRLVALTPKEFDVIALLARHQGTVVPRERILREVWHTTWHGFGRSLEVHIAQVRRKVDHPRFIETIRGVGYRLVA